MAQIVLVHDHPVVRLGLRTVLAGEPDLAVVGEATSAPGAVRAVSNHRPDLVVLDVRLEGRPLGPELCRTLKTAPDGPAVLVLAARAAATEMTAMYLAGADSFVDQTSTTGEIVASVRATLGGRRVWAPHPLPVNGAHGPPVPHPDPPEHLTPREREVLGLLLQRLTNAEIAAELHLGMPTVKTHVSAVLRKLGLTRRLDLFHDES
ncbi:LuxR family two component transcriptional regulator [Georgenia soli]|uniref:LuxR family two component transcriptional regulator n=1 Tax=Georgenia soli TaxID=638953 RepID=A0A2A9ELG7_9MICO|nr:response regulator transcription factor [Georgenia soli]PFG39446.1 LuxR family two component transcriptional regulator [Georgenia soli]